MSRKYGYGPTGGIEICLRMPSVFWEGRFFLEKMKMANSPKEWDGRRQFLWNCLVDLDTRLIAAHGRIAKLESNEIGRLEDELARSRQQLVERDG
jgi:hypothetical protein